jgi:hypothetical protein
LFIHTLPPLSAATLQTAKRKASPQSREASGKLFLLPIFLKLTATLYVKILRFLSLPLIATSNSGV